MNALHIKNKNFLNLEEFELNMDEENFIIYQDYYIQFFNTKEYKDKYIQEQKNISEIASSFTITYHEISPLCLLYQFEIKHRKHLYTYFCREYFSILQEFKNKKYIIEKKNNFDKIIIYKKDKCIICLEECTKFIKSPCCNNSYGCYKCMLKYKMCLICHKKIDALYIYIYMNYNKALQIANEIKKK